jgi:putative transposase
VGVTLEDTRPSLMHHPPHQQHHPVDLHTQAFQCVLLQKNILGYSLREPLRLPDNPARRVEQSAITLLQPVPIERPLARPIRAISNSRSFTLRRRLLRRFLIHHVGWAAWMGTPYSMDLRERVVAAVKTGGMSCNRAAKRFGVGVGAAIYRVKRSSACVRPGASRRARWAGTKKIAGEHRLWLLQRIRQGDFTLRGLLDRVEPVPLSVPNTPRDALAIRNNR